jgi:predicted methyltransferase
MRRLLLASCIALATLSGCASTADGGIASDATASPGSAAPSAETAPASDIAAVLANPARPTEDRERDARDKPAEVLALAQFEAGDTVADILAGSGYYSEILSGIVGPQGQVLLVNDTRYDAFGKEGYTKRLADGRLPNVRHVVGPADALGMGENVLDGAVIVMSYHDLYWVDDEKPGQQKIDADQFLDQIARALKPGGALLVVDHSAKAGTGSSDAQTLHRIDEQFAIADFKQHGLRLETELPLLRNAADDRSKNVFDPAIRGKTDRFVHLYRKAE